MIRYAFLAQFDPPAPFVNAVVRNPVSGAEWRDQPAQLDTAADRSVLPDSLVKSLPLPQVGTMRLADFGGATYTLPVYAVLLGLHDLPIRPFNVRGNRDIQDCL